MNGNYKDSIHNSGSFVDSNGTLFLDLNGKSSQKMILSGNATGVQLFNIEEGREVSLMVSGAGTSDYTFCTGHDIHFVGQAPSTIPSGKIGILTVKSFGASTGECIGAFAVQD